MSNKDTTPTTGERPAVAPILFDMPFFVIVDQTPKKNNVRIMQGEAGEALDSLRGRVNDEASAAAMSLGRPVAILGPQFAVKVPPEKPVAAELDLGFNKPAPEPEKYAEDASKAPENAAATKGAPETK